MKTNYTLALAKKLCAKEGKLKQVNIAQMCEIIAALRKMFHSSEVEELLTVVRALYHEPASEAAQLFVTDVDKKKGTLTISTEKPKVKKLVKFAKKKPKAKKKK